MQTAQTAKQQIIEGLDALSEEDLHKVLAFMRSLQEGPLAGKGIPGPELAAFFDQFPPPTLGEAEAMKRIMDDIESEG